MELGYPKAANVVTVLGAEGIHNIMGIGQKAEGYLKLVADHLAGTDRAHRSAVLLIIAQDTAAMLAREGWTKETIKQYIREHALMLFLSTKSDFSIRAWRECWEECLRGFLKRTIQRR